MQADDDPMNIHNKPAVLADWVKEETEISINVFDNWFLNFLSYMYQELRKQECDLSRIWN